MSNKSDSEGSQEGTTPQWYVYLMRCADNSLYTGVTTDPERRVREHNGELKGKGAKIHPYSKTCDLSGCHCPTLKGCRLSSRVCYQALEQVRERVRCLFGIDAYGV